MATNCFNKSVFWTEINSKKSFDFESYISRLLYLIKERKNLCNQIHIPAQSGSTSVLQRMRRGYTRDAYLQLVDHMYQVLGSELALSTDLITGFCGETEEEHAETKNLMETVKYDHAFIYKYSQREKTHAHRHYSDDVHEEVKAQRLEELLTIFLTEVRKKAKRFLGTTQLVLLDCYSRTGELQGRTEGNKRVYVPQVLLDEEGRKMKKLPQIGDYVEVRVTSAGMGALMGIPLRFSSPSSFSPFPL